MGAHVREKEEWRIQLTEAEKIRDEVWRDHALEMVKSAMPRNWVAAMTYLERKYPSEFSLRNIVRTESSERAVYAELTGNSSSRCWMQARRSKLRRRKGSNYQHRHRKSESNSLFLLLAISLGSQNNASQWFESPYLQVLHRESLTRLALSTLNSYSQQI